MLTDLPAPGRRWRSNVISDELADQLVGLRNRGIVRRTDRVETAEYAKRRCLWETDPGAYQYLQRILEDDDREGLFPCGHSAIKNERDVDGITCGVCGEVHDRSEVTGNV